jgi:hypothetical protein
MAKKTQIIYNDDLQGGGRQLMLDDDDTAKLLRRIAAREGRVVTEFPMEIDGEPIDVVSLTPDTLLADERRAIEALIERSYEMLLELKRIVLRHG